MLALQVQPNSQDILVGKRLDGDGAIGAAALLPRGSKALIVRMRMYQRIIVTECVEAVGKSTLTPVSNFIVNLSLMQPELMPSNMTLIIILRRR